MKYALIAPDGHRILQTGEVPEEMVEMQGGDLLALPAPEEVGDDTHYWDGAAFQPYPPRPAPFMTCNFVSLAWEDQRSPEQLAAELAARRSRAEMSRADFLLAAIGAGILQASDAGPAARGKIPPSLLPVFAAMPQADQIEAVVRWGAATVIDRMNPVLLLLAAGMGIPDAGLDALFGIDAP